MTKYLTGLLLSVWLMPTAASADQQLAKGKLLVASEFVVGEIFAKTVILLMHYDDTGAMGLVVNRPTEVELGEVLADVEAASAYSGTLYWGGPVRMSSLRALLHADTPPEDSQEVVDSVYQLPVDEALAEVAMDPASLRFFIGYAGWTAGQLDNELARGDWHVVPASHELVFAEDPRLLWQRLRPLDKYRATANIKSVDQGLFLR